MTVLDQTPDDRPELLEKFRSFVARLRKYRATKNAVRKGEHLWQLSKADLASRALAGPWELNLMETAFAAIPALTIAKLLRLLFPERPEVVRAQEALSPTLKLTQDFYEYLVTLATPLSLFALVLIVARASLRPKDATPERVRVARRAYLYLDGSYGLLPQAIVSIGVAGGAAVLEREVPSGDILGIIFVLLFYVGMFWNIYHVGRKIPRLLFSLNGYNPLPRKENSGPWTRYSLAFLLLGPIVVWTLLALLWLAAFSGAWLIVQLRATLT